LEVFCWAFGLDNYGFGRYHCGSEISGLRGFHCLSGINMQIIKARKISYVFSGVLVILSVAALALWGLNLGIDFTGGSIFEIEYQTARPGNDAVRGALEELKLGNIVIQPTGETGVFLRTRDLDEATHQQVLLALRVLGEMEEKRFSSIGPTIGAELKRNSLWAIALVVLMILIYIAWVFRKVSRPMASWKYGITAIAALIHDILIPVGVFAVLGRFFSAEADVLFITALLTILGYSVHDTIVVFDRIRENLKEARGGVDFEEIVERGVKSTLVRSINTSATTLLVLLALVFWGGSTTVYFALIMALGIFFGTYSSIFVASALLVSWHKWEVSRA
jgi:preprotein translocase subunit SecF